MTDAEKIEAALIMLGRAIAEHKFWLDGEAKANCEAVLADARAALDRLLQAGA